MVDIPDPARLLEMIETRFGVAGPWLVRPVLILFLLFMAVACIAGMNVAWRTIFSPPGIQPKPTPPDAGPVPQAVPSRLVPPHSARRNPLVVVSRALPNRPIDRVHQGDNFINNGTNNGIIGPVTIAPTEPNVLYQNGQRIGTVLSPSVSGDTITFAEVRFTDTVDTARPIRFQRYSMICETPAVVSDATMFMDLVQNVRCSVSGAR